MWSQMKLSASLAHYKTGNNEVAVRGARTLFTQSSNPLQKVPEAFCYPLGIAEHILKTTCQAKLFHFVGEEAKFQTLKEDSGVAEAPQQYLRPFLATLLLPRAFYIVGVQTVNECKESLEKVQ